MWWRPRPELDLERVRGCLLGGALGDAVGARHEGAPPAGGRALRPGHFTDDTQLTLATAEAIAEAGRADPERIAAGLLAWHRRDPIRGVGAATAKALRELSVGGHWALVGRTGEHAAGNGAAIRIAPLAFVLDPRDPKARRTIRDVARITHRSDEAYAGALAVCLAVHDALSDDLDLDLIAAALPDSGVRDRLREIARLELRDAAARGTSGWVVDAVPLALRAASIPDFESMLAEVVTLGGDCDSIGSMAGQIWGARHGAAALPAAMLRELPGRDDVERVAHAFARTRPDR